MVKSEVQPYSIYTPTISNIKNTFLGFYMIIYTILMHFKTFRILPHLRARGLMLTTIIVNKKSL